jgi:hypothetical protein
MSELRKQTRVEWTLSEVERLQNEFDRWKEKRDKADRKQQNQTQLTALAIVVEKALTDIKEDVGEILKGENGKPSVGQVYDRCTHQERRLLWVRRVLWGYYRRKFDQRDESNELKKLLEAADDVVWSCYKEAFSHAGEDLKPVPMAYIEPYFSPLALPRDKPQGLLAESHLKEKHLGNEFLSELFTELPIPLVSLPPACLVAPWWLVYVGHEVGHHVQHDLDLVEGFGKLLRDVATSSDEPKETDIQANRWYNWGQEIFADTFSIYMMGGAAAWAMAEFETHQDQMMAVRKDDYPSPAARLALLARLAGKLKVQGAADLLAADPSTPLIEQPGLTKAFRDNLVADWNMLEKMAVALTTKPVGQVGPMADLSGWAPGRFAEYGEVYDWQDSLARPAYEKSSPSRQAARLIVSAGVEEWRLIVDRDMESWRQVVSHDVARWGSVATADQVTEPGVLPRLRSVALAQLEQELLSAIEKNRDVTTRAAAPEILVEVDDIAARASAQLRTAEFVEW